MVGKILVYVLIFLGVVATAVTLYGTSPLTA